MRYGIVETAWGAFGFVERDGRLVATYLPQRADRVRRAIARAYPTATEDSDALPEFRRQVIDYFRGRHVQFATDIDVSDLPWFRRVVLEVARGIPYGKTVSYADLARSVGRPAAARAVGGAMANNPLPLVVPCHRVLRSDGTLGGFSSPGGLTLKARMLQLEDASALYGPAPSYADGPENMAEPATAATC